MPAPSYLANVLDTAVMHRAKEPIPTEHRSGVIPPAIDLADPAVTAACDSRGWASVVCTWRKTGGLATAKLDLQILVWDPCAEAWDHGDVITAVASDQAIVFPTGGCRFWIKIVGIADVTGISAWKILLRPWDKR
jgi:hypothetical protein